MREPACEAWRRQRASSLADRAYVLAKHDACRIPGRPTRDVCKLDTSMARKPTTIDEYLDIVGDERRSALDRLRKAIRKIVPAAEECISYGIPAFRIHGVVVAGFAARAKGSSYFPFSGSTLKTLAQDLKEYEQTKSSLHIGADEVLPTALVRRLLKARIAEIQDRRPRSTRARSVRRRRRA